MKRNTGIKKGWKIKWKKGLENEKIEKNISNSKMDFIWHSITVCGKGKSI